MTGQSQGVAERGPVASAAAALAEPALPATIGVSSAYAVRPGSPWLLGAGYDALLIANVAWPLLLLMQVGEGFAGREGLQFWQVYFLSTPHRWITLGLVFLDREQFRQRGGLFVLIAAAVVLACLCIRASTGTLLCLLAVDYLWNAWHFASQHHGIYRLYDRRADALSPSAAPTAAGRTIEKWTMRLLLLYVIVRVAGTTWRYERLEQSLLWADWLACAAAVWLIARDLWQLRPSQPRRLYLLSMLALYLSLLAAVHWNWPAAVLSLATASAVFHATEYLTLVTWSVQQREAKLGRRLGVLAHLAPRWGLGLAVFLLLLGTGGWLMENHWAQSWLLLNVIVAFLHYAYDGLIWRSSAAAA